MLLVLRHMVSYVLILATRIYLVMPAKSQKLKREIQTVRELHLSVSQESVWKTGERSL